MSKTGENPFTVWPFTRENIFLNRRFRFFAIIFVLIILGIAGTPYASADISITIVNPPDNGLAGNELKVVTAIDSTYEIANVTAIVEGREASLIFSSTAYPRSSVDK